MQTAKIIKNTNASIFLKYIKGSEVLEYLLLLVVLHFNTFIYSGWENNSGAGALLIF